MIFGQLEAAGLNAVGHLGEPGLEARAAVGKRWSARSV
jgi:hypothetical protein